MPSKAMPEIPLGHLIIGNIGGTEYPVSAPDDPRNVLTVRDSRDAPRTLSFRAQSGNSLILSMASSRPATVISISTATFSPGKFMNTFMSSADPVVAGLAFAAVRDFASYAKHASDSITPVERVYGEGISQNGRFLRDFLYQGFNADEDGKIALDGVLAHVAGAGRGRLQLSFRAALARCAADFVGILSD